MLGDLRCIHVDFAKLKMQELIPAFLVSRKNKTDSNPSKKQTTISKSKI